MMYRLPLLVLLLLSLVSLKAVAEEPIFRVNVITNDFVLPSKLNKLRTWAAEQQIDLQGFYVEDQSTESDWFKADLVLIDTPRGNDRAQVMATLKAELDNTTTPWLAIGGGPPLSQHLSKPIMGRVMGYYSSGGESNFRHLFQYLSAWHRKQPLNTIPEPEPLLDSGIYHPDAGKNLTNWTDYKAWGESRWSSDAPVLAVAMSSTFIANSQTVFYDQLIHQIEQAGGIPLVFWFDRRQKTGLEDVIAESEPVMLVNTTHMVSGELRKHEFQQLNIPVVIGLTSRQHDIESWREAAQGINSGMSAAMVSIPESLGMSDPLVLAALEEGEPVAIPEQLDLLVGRFMSQAKLKQLPREQFRLALMFWNSPGGEKNLSASNLNIPKSIEQITESLFDEGYGIPRMTEQQVISSAQQMLSAYYDPQKLLPLLERGLAITLPVSEYKNWLDSLPDSKQQELLTTWGKPEENWAVRDIEGQAMFVIPAIQNQQLLWLPQPPRADKLGESTHDLKQAPGHLYLATYLLLRNAYQANALIHLGTHGTQEWTPGKDRGLWAYDYPNLAVGNMPVFYPYIQDNIGEAIQAKRRGRAITISHQTPPYSPAGLYDELLSVHDLMHQYMQLEDGGVKDQTQRQIVEQAISFDLHKDLGWDEQQLEQDFDTFLLALHDHLHQLAQATTPLGLHTFGQSAEQLLRIATVMQQLGKAFYERLDVDSEELFAASFDTMTEQKPFTFLASFIKQPELVETIENEVLRDMVKQAISRERGLSENGEIEALSNALRGGFITPGLGGDPVRQPDTTSGTNLYAFDPEKLPSKAAYDASEAVYQSLIYDYQQQNGEYPDKLAFTLWSSEAIRTYGLIEGQILHALGVRPVWDAGGKVIRFEIIPDEQLSQPRVDVVLQVTSVYRDQFDGLMKKLADVIEQLATQNTSQNVIARNSELIQQQLLEQGLSELEAIRFSRARLFSNPPGDYGSGVTDIAMDSTAWDDDKILADTFIQSQSHIYTSQDWGTPVEELNLLQSQLTGTDAVVLSRSSNLHGLLSTDHPFEYLGGLSVVVKQIDGSNPRLYVSDSRQQQTRMTAANQFISDELRTRYQNPQWIKGMQNEGYAGTVEIVKIVNNVFGWQVMDANMIRADQWQALHETYVMDKRNLGVNEWFEEMNPTAQAQLIERMVEAIRKGYWDASNQTRQELVSRWQTLVDEKGAEKGAVKTVDYIQQNLVGFGLDGVKPEAAGKTETVSGQILQEQQQNEMPDFNWLWILLGLLSVVATGICRRLYQYQQWKFYDR